MPHTPNVFIASSSEGLAVAKALERVLGRDKRIDVQVWSGAFRPGMSFMDMLHLSTLQYDFGIMVLTPDDSTDFRGNTVNEPRDNVLFELGLFRGARGNRRAIPVWVTADGRRPSVPTDLKGVSQDRLSVTSLKRSMDELVAEVEVFGEELAERMLRDYRRPEPSILPSTGLAIGYFHNFILPVIRGLYQRRQVSAWGKGNDRQARAVDLEHFTIHVCIPDDLSQATRELWGNKADKLLLTQAEVEPSDDKDLPRPYPFRVGAAQNDGHTDIYDTPTTLLTARHVARRLLSSEHYEQEDRAMAEEREIHNFERTVRWLLDQPEHQHYAKHVRFVPWNKL